MKKKLLVLTILLTIALSLLYLVYNVNAQNGCDNTPPASGWLHNLTIAHLDDCGSGIDVTGTLTVQSVYPDGNGTRMLGATNARWSDVQSILIRGSDIGFANSWKLREFPATKADLGKSDEWFRKNANQGIALLNDKDEVIAVFHRNGNLYMGGKMLPLSELPK